MFESIHSLFINLTWRRLCLHQWVYLVSFERLLCLTLELAKLLNQLSFSLFLFLFDALYLFLCFQRSHPSSFSGWGSSEIAIHFILFWQLIIAHAFSFILMTFYWDLIFVSETLTNSFNYLLPLKLIALLKLVLCFFGFPFSKFIIFLKCVQWSLLLSWLRLIFLGLCILILWAYKTDWLEIIKIRF